MTKKLTLTIDSGVVDAAKKYARETGRSLSGVVENYLKAITANKEQAVEKKIFSPKVTKLMGVVNVPADFDYKAEIEKAILEKYKIR